MRKLLCASQLSLCLVAIVAACSSPAGNEAAAGDNAAAANEGAANAGAAADANAAEPSAAGNEANGSANAAATGNEAIVFRANGTEPFWTLTMGTQMVYDSADGPDVTVATPPGRSTRTGPVYETPEMEVWINQVADCEDASGQSGMPVRVRIGTQVANGCGSGTFPD